MALVGQLANRGFALLLTLVAARALGPTEFSDFALFTNLALFAAAFALPGLDADVIRTMGSSTRRVLRLKAIAIAISAVFLVVGSRWLLDYHWVLVALALVSGYAQGLAETPESLLVVRNRLVARAVAQAGPSAAALAAALVMGASALATITLLMLVVAVRDLTRLAYGFGITRPLRSSREGRTATPSSRTLGQLAVITILGYVYYRVDVLLLGASSHTDDVGLYAGAYSIVIAIQNIPGALGPVLLRELTASPQRARRILLVQFSGGVVAGALVLAFSGPLVRVILGSNFAGSVELLRVLALTVPLLFLNGALLRLLLSRHRDSWVLVALVVVTASSIALNYTLIRSHGAIGAAWASVLVELLLSILFVLAIRFRSGVREEIV